MIKNRVEEFIKNPKRAMFILAYPLVIGMLVQVMYNIVDTAFVGRLGAEAIAALTFSFPLFFMLIALNSGLGAGVGSRISRFLGEGNKKGAENTAIHGLLISLLLAFVVFILGELFLRQMFNVFGATGNVLGLSITYMSIILLGTFFMFPSFTISSIFSAQGDTKTPMKVQITVLLLNIILDPIFIYVLGWGVAGAAIATLTAFFFSLLMFVYYIRKKSYLCIKPKCFKFSMPIVKEIFSVGAPAGLMTLLLSIYVIFINKLMVHFSVEHVASFGIASRLESVAVIPIVAFSMAMPTLVGMFFGAKKYSIMRETIFYGLKIAVLFTSLVGGCFLHSPGSFLKNIHP